MTKHRLAHSHDLDSDLRISRTPYSSMSAFCLIFVSHFGALTPDLRRTNEINRKTAILVQVCA